MIKKIFATFLFISILFIVVSGVCFSIDIVKSITYQTLEFRHFAIIVLGKVIILLTKSVIFWTGGLIVVSSFLNTIITKINGKNKLYHKDKR